MKDVVNQCLEFACSSDELDKGDDPFFEQPVFPSLHRVAPLALFSDTPATSPFRSFSQLETYMSRKRVLPEVGTESAILRTEGGEMAVVSPVTVFCRVGVIRAMEHPIARNLDDLDNRKPLSTLTASSLRTLLIPGITVTRCV